MLAYSTFYSPTTGPYVETYLSVKGESVEFVMNESGQYQSKIQVTIVFKSGETVKAFEKYNLLSPEVADPKSTAFSFIDQQRFLLANGKYTMEVSISDAHGTKVPFTSKQEIKIEYHPNIVAISDIELVDHYGPAASQSLIAKSGYDMVPLVANFYPQKTSDLKFYAEVYNTSEVFKQESYLVNYYISSFETKRIIEKYKSFIKQNPNDVNPIIGNIPIGELPSGNYLLTVEVRNKKNDLITFKEQFFQRSNTMVADNESNDYSLVNINNTFVQNYTTESQLKDYISSIRPISNNREVAFADNQLDISNVEMMQKFFYSFWERKNPTNPEMAWLEYAKQVQKVNESYSTRIMRGYETDRGRVYLKYGAPNSIAQKLSEPSAYPYEIWHYYKLDNQSNRKFIFYNPDLVTNDFQLIHSDALGEVNDPRWQMKIMKRDNQSRDFDTERVEDHFGSKSNLLFDMPR